MAFGNKAIVKSGLIYTEGRQVRPYLEKATRHMLGVGNHWPLESEASSVGCACFLCYTTRSPSICPTHTAAWGNKVPENCRDNIKNGELNI